MLTKVPEVTLSFWVIKVLCTTVGETAADFLNADLGFGLTGTSIVTGLVLAVVLGLQFRARCYVPGLDWTGLDWASVTLVSVFGTLVTDNPADNFGVPLLVSTILFGLALAFVFSAWCRTEGTLSIHSIDTRPREAFYWMAILVTFALGTASGDLMSEALSLGYVVSALVVLGVIAVISLARRLGLHPVLAFWILYVLSRLLGAALATCSRSRSTRVGWGSGPPGTWIEGYPISTVLGAGQPLTRPRWELGKSSGRVDGPVNRPHPHRSAMYAPWGPPAARVDPGPLIAGTRPDADRGSRDHWPPVLVHRVAARDVVAMMASVGGGLLLFVVGLAFLGAALWSWSCRTEEPDRRRSLGIAVDVLVGSVALTDAAMSVLDEPARLLLWSAGSVVLFVALVLLHRHRRLPRRDRSFGAVRGLTGHPR